MEMEVYKKAREFVTKQRNLGQEINAWESMTKDSITMVGSSVPDDLFDKFKTAIIANLKQQLIDAIREFESL